jgi:hypothetical protein
MLPYFCPKHRMARALCGCLAASIAAPYLGSVWNGDPQAKLPRINIMGQGLTMGATGSATISAGITYISDTISPGKTYALVRQDQQGQAILGPTGPIGGDNLVGNPASVTGPTGPA